LAGTIPVVVVPPFRSLRTPASTDGDLPHEIPALREDIRLLQQRLSTAEHYLVELTGIFRSQLLDQNTGQLPESFRSFDRLLSAEQQQLPGPSRFTVAPVHPTDPTPGRTIYSPVTQRAVCVLPQSATAMDVDNEMQPSQIEPPLQQVDRDTHSAQDPATSSERE
jgi:hypothetical protein